MAIIKNAVPFGNGFNIGSASPIDSRMRVPYLSDLTSVWGTDAPAYAGMVVIVNEEDKAYILKTSGFNELTGAPIAADPTVLDNWKPIGSNEILSAESYDAAVALATDELRGSVIFVVDEVNPSNNAAYVIYGASDIRKIATNEDIDSINAILGDPDAIRGEEGSGITTDVSFLVD